MICFSGRHRSGEKTAPVEAADNRQGTIGPDSGIIRVIQLGIGILVPEHSPLNHLELMTPGLPSPCIASSRTSSRPVPVA